MLGGLRVSPLLSSCTLLKKKRGSVKENDVIYEGMSGNSTRYYAYSVKWSPDDK